MSLATPVQNSMRLYPVGKMWLPATDKGQSNIRFDRDLPDTLEIAPGSNLVVRHNDKREGKQDADFRVYVSLESAVYDALVAARPAKPAVEA